MGGDLDRFLSILQSAGIGYTEQQVVKTKRLVKSYYTDISVNVADQRADDLPYFDEREGYNPVTVFRFRNSDRSLVGIGTLK